MREKTVKDVDLNSLWAGCWKMQTQSQRICILGKHNCRHRKDCERMCSLPASPECERERTSSSPWRSTTIMADTRIRFVLLEWFSTLNRLWLIPQIRKLNNIQSNTTIYLINLPTKAGDNIPPTRSTEPKTLVTSFVFFKFLLLTNSSSRLQIVLLVVWVKYLLSG